MFGCIQTQHVIFEAILIICGVENIANIHIHTQILGFLPNWYTAISKIVFMVTIKCDVDNNGIYSMKNSFDIAQNRLCYSLSG